MASCHALDASDRRCVAPIALYRLDTRSDDEILARLRTHIPVTDDKNVWAFWDGGIDAMPPWCRRNIISWVRRLGPDWTVRVLDVVAGSPNHAHRFVAPDRLPHAFNAGTMDGRSKGQHRSDMVRLAALVTHGGVYMDVSIILFRTIEDICWREIEDVASPFRVACIAYQSREYFGQILNSFIACKRDEPFIRRWHDVFLEMWRDRTEAEGIHDHPLIRHLGLLRTDDPIFGNAITQTDFSDYCAHMLAFERLRLLREPTPNGFNGSAYFRRHFFLFDGFEEAYRSQDKYDGDTQFALLRLPRKLIDQEGANSPEQADARGFAHDMLGRSAMAKFAAGYWRPGMPFGLANHWARPENADADLEPGTWWEFVRWGSDFLEQTRLRDRCLEPLPIPEEQDSVIVKGYLEP